jgi:hypothetical protein
MPCRVKNAEHTKVRNVGLMSIVLQGCDTTGTHVDWQAVVKVARDAREADKSANRNQTYFKVLHPRLWMPLKGIQRYVPLFEVIEAISACVCPMKAC